MEILFQFIETSKKDNVNYQMSKTKGLPKTLNASADLAVWTSPVERFLEHLLFRYKWFLITWLDLHTQKLLGKMKILKKVLIHLFESGKTTIEQNLISSFNHFLGLAIPNTWVAGKRERFAYWERLQEKTRFWTLRKYKWIWWKVWQIHKWIKVFKNESSKIF